MVKAFDSTIIHPSWDAAIRPQMRQEYFHLLAEFLQHERQTYTIYPPPSLVFNAFHVTAFTSLKICLLGQDPYHQPRQAHGLAFSVPTGIKKPPSLRNIFKELRTDCTINESDSGDLTAWARQGVLLLNTILTVRHGTPASHHDKGWELFTDAVISAISALHRGIIFFLWGAHAQKKETLIDTRKHYILTAAHPSPFSAMHGFFGCRHFSTANGLLSKVKKQPIDWRL